MRTLAALLLAAVALGQEDRPQIAWTGGLPSLLERARRENRPVFVSVNALDTEAGTTATRNGVFRDEKLVAVARAFECVVAAPGQHGDGAVCARFGSCSCAEHREVLTWVLSNFTQDGTITSPTHLLLDAEGRVLFQRSFFLDANALRREMEKALVQVSPRRALALADRTRAAERKRLADGGDAVAYAKSDDPLAPAVLLLLYEEAADARWIEALTHAPRAAFGLVRLYLQDDLELLPVASAMDSKLGRFWARFHAEAVEAKLPPPADRKLAAAARKLAKGDKSGLELLLGALADPVDGPEVRAALTKIAGTDYGDKAPAWREVFAQ